MRNPIFTTPGVKNRTRGDFLKIGRPAGDAEDVAERDFLQNDVSSRTVEIKKSALARSARELAW